MAISQTSSDDREAVPAFKVIIIGAGIAGLGAAAALRAPGREIVVLESSRLKSEIGAAIHLAANATKITAKWGLDIQKAARATVCREYQEISGSDNVIHVKAPIDTVKAFGAPWLFQHRVDLHNALRSFAEDVNQPGPPAKIITGAKVTSVDCDAGLVETAAAGSFQADLIIGADGIHSDVRKAVLGEMQIAQPSGHSAYRCLIPEEKVRDIPEVAEVLSVDHSTLKIVVSGNRRVILYPCRDATILNIVAVCPDGHMKEESTQSWSQEGTTKDMLAAFDGFPAWVMETLEKAERPGLYQLRDQDPLPTWVRGRAIIIGDAAHSMLPHQGQGAGQSIEDAEALGAYFEHVQGPQQASVVTDILQKVFDGRYKRASTIQQFSRQQAKPAGVGKGEPTNLNAQQFVGYNMSYDGVLDWVKRDATAVHA